jgi:hypothetical protein
MLSRVQKRADCGRLTNVLFNGVALGEERIERERARRRSKLNMRRDNIEGSVSHAFVVVFMAEMR